MNIDFEKDEFNFYATSLVFGQRGSRINDFKQFKFPVFRNDKKITFNEIQGLNKNNRMDMTRQLRINSHFIFKTDDTSMSSSTSKIIHFTNLIHHVSSYDKIFTEQEFNYFERNWDLQVKEKIRKVGILIRSVFFGSIDEAPIFMEEFPNITCVLLDHPEWWVKEV